MQTATVIFKNIVRANMLRARNKIHTGWKQQILMYIDEHIYVYTITSFILSGT